MSHSQLKRPTYFCHRLVYVAGDNVVGNGETADFRGTGVVPSHGLEVDVPVVIGDQLAHCRR